MENNDVFITLDEQQQARLFSAIAMMPSGVVELESHEHLHELLHQYPEEIFLFYFSAKWCAPCQQYSPQIHKLEEKLGDEIIFVKVDMDEVGEVSSSLRVKGVPSTIVIHKGRELLRRVGVIPVSELRSILASIIDQVKN